MADQIDCTWDGKLPVDIMVSILSNLPVKSLLRFKAVCQSWRSLISSPIFIKLHLHRQSVIANNLLLSWHDNIDYYVTQLGVLSHNYDISKILPPWSCVEGLLYVVDSCKGLVCISNYKEHVLWNPATRRYRSLKLPKKASCRSFDIIGLGFVEPTNDYKIVKLALNCTPPYEQNLFVYTLSSDSWKELDYHSNFFPIYPAVPPTFINGCIHWLGNICTCRCTCGTVFTCSSRVNKIIAFDVEDEVMCCFGVPYNYDPHNKISMQSLAIKGCLSVLSFPKSGVMESEIEIWVMVEYGVEGSWVKQYTIQGLTTVELPLRSWNGSEILFIGKEEGEGLHKLMFYEPSGKTKIFKETKVFNYVESLASVD